MAPHSILTFDPSSHLYGHENFVKGKDQMVKTMQTRDAVQVISLSKLSNRAMCPYRALKSLKKLYPTAEMHSVFQVRTPSGLAASHGH